MNGYTVLVVDDDREIAESIGIYLKNEGYSVLIAHDGQEAVDILTENAVHLILLDVMLPKMDGIRATLKIRETKELKSIPIILVSAKSEDVDKIHGLTVGADDYITKPFNPLELIARVKSAIRRYTNLGAIGVLGGSVTVIDGLIFDTENKLVTVDGAEVKLTAIEYKILKLLCENQGRVFSADEIYRNVWNEDVFVNDNTVAVHVRRIREKIEIDPKKPKYLKVVWGIGYKIEKFAKRGKIQESGV
jgi:DNA-binding response OmpR family regulator